MKCSKPICSGCKRNKLDCIWPDPAASAPSNSSATSSAKVAAAVSRSSRPSFGASSTGSQTSISSSLRRSQDRDQEYDQGQGRDPHSATDPVLPDSAPDQDRAFADNPGIVVPHNGDSSPVSGDTHMIDAHDTQVDDDDHDVETVVNDNADHQPSHSPSSSASSESPTAITTYDSDTANAITLALPPSPEGGLPLNGVITMPMSMLPEQGHHSYELLSYYLDRTANSMGNGSTDVNPFISKLIPLAFSKPLVLQLILAQSAAHRQASAERHPSDEIAQRYYTDSLRMFRNVVDEYVSGNAENTLVLTVGSLIMCLTEVGRPPFLLGVSWHMTGCERRYSWYDIWPSNSIKVISEHVTHRSTKPSIRWLTRLSHRVLYAHSSHEHDLDRPPVQLTISTQPGYRSKSQELSRKEVCRTIMRMLARTSHSDFSDLPSGTGHVVADGRRRYITKSWQHCQLCVSAISSNGFLPRPFSYTIYASCRVSLETSRPVISLDSPGQTAPTTRRKLPARASRIRSRRSSNTPRSIPRHGENKHESLLAARSYRVQHIRPISTASFEDATADDAGYHRSWKYEADVGAVRTYLGAAAWAG